MKKEFVFKHNEVDVEIRINAMDELAAWRKLRFIVGSDERLIPFTIVM
jgi:hypothetical protein